MTRATTAPAASGGLSRSAIAAAVILLVAVAVALYTTGQIAPAGSDREAQDRLSTVSNGSGNIGLALLAVLVCLGFALSHPVGPTSLRVSRALYPWHIHLWVFVLAFFVVHIGATVLDPFARVSFVGAFVPGLSAYRTAPVALGTLALYALLITGLTAKSARRLPLRVWLSIHRVSVLVFVLAWLHVYLVGGTEGLDWLYAATGLAVIVAGAYWLWAATRGRPSFVASLAAERATVAQRQVAAATDPPTD